MKRIIVVLALSTHGISYAELAAPTITGFNDTYKNIEIYYTDNSDAKVNFKIERNGNEIGTRGDVAKGESATFVDWTKRGNARFEYRMRAYNVKTKELSEYSNVLVVANPEESPPTPLPPVEPPKPPTTDPTLPAPGGTEIKAANAAELVKALAAAQPGQTIVLSPGTYGGKFVATAKGEPGKPITLTGPSTAILDGGSNHASGYVLYLNGASYWQVVGISLTRGQKGLVMDGASYNIIDGIAVYDIGDEAVHFRKNSTHNVIMNSKITNTGNRTPGYGEGVYIGSAKSNLVGDRSDYNSVIGNFIGPGVTAEHIDAKEYSSHGLIEGNIFDGTGQTGKNYAVSSVFIKGNDYLVRGNTVTNPFKEAYRVNVIVAGESGDRNVFEKNTADVGGKGLGFNIVKGTGNVVRCDNVVRNAEAFSNVKCTQ